MRTWKGRMSLDEWSLPTWVEDCLWSISGDPFTKSSILIISEKASQRVPHPQPIQSPEYLLRSKCMASSIKTFHLEVPF